MVLNNIQKQKFIEDGFLLLENFISPILCTHLKSIINSLSNSEINLGISHLYDSHLQRVWNLISKDKIFREIIIDERILGIMNWIFDRDTLHRKFLLSSFQANIIGPGGKKQVLHIDTPVPDPVPSWPLKANTIWCLDEFTEYNGATIVVPGSHRFLRRPNLSDDQSIENQVTIICPSGSILITHGALWHCSGENKSHSPRIALLGSFAASYTREISSEEDYSKVIPSYLLPELNGELINILGLDLGIKPGAL